MTTDNILKLVELNQADAQKRPGDLEDRVALHFADQYAEHFRYIAVWGRWMLFDGLRWHPEDTLEAFDKARVLCREASDAKAKIVNAVVTLARADRAIAATEKQWDIGGMIFNSPSATVDLTGGVERPADAKDYITKLSGTPMAKAGTPHPLWDDFLNRVTDNNSELINFLKRFLGYCMTGKTSEHVLLFLYGGGANGKGVFVNTVTNIFGDYAVAAPMELFMASKYERHPTELAKLRGARLVVAQETEKGRRWDTTKIKMLTSEDTLTGRFMRQDFFDFKPTHKLIISGNYKPSLRSVDEAMRRRLLLVPFTVTIPVGERDPHFAEKLKPEWPAILRWILDGCLEWQSDGLGIPEIVRMASNEYFEEQDIMGLFIETWIVRDGTAFTSTANLFKTWKVWCEQGNHYVGHERSFSDELADHGFERGKSQGVRGFKGLALRANDGPREWDE